MYGQHILSSKNIILYARIFSNPFNSIMDGVNIEGCAWHIECATTGRAMRKCCAEFYITAMLLLLAGTVKAVKQGHHDRLSLTKKLFCKGLIYLFSKWFWVNITISCKPHHSYMKTLWTQNDVIVTYYYDITVTNGDCIWSNNPPPRLVRP